VPAAHLPRLSRWVPASLALALGPCLLACLVSSATALPPPSTLDKPLPDSLEDLKAIQAKVKQVVDRVLPCTVAVRAGGGQGSGVIISADGYVLTAAHVSGPADHNVTVILPDGRKFKGKSLGANRGIDCGLVKITDEGKWPHAEMGHSGEVKRGQWCVALGHPGGYKTGRPPVVRVGRVLKPRHKYLQTECTLVGGDSGGPLFDLDGKVIGIHSRIGNSIAANIHVPVDAFRDSWDRLVSGEVWGGRYPGRSGREPYIGVRGDGEADHCRIRDVIPGSPADRAGLRPDDVVTRFAGKKVGAFDDLVAGVQSQQPGDEVLLEVVRGGERLTLRVTVGRRPDDSN
jgi:serine protease Do